MAVILYVDLLFVFNFMMDLLLLILVSKILGQPFLWKRLLLAGAAGSLWSCICVSISWLHGFLYILFSYILMSGIILCIAYGIRSRYILMRNLAAWYFAAALTGGIFQSLQTLLAAEFRSALSFLNLSESHIPAFVNLVLTGFLSVKIVAVMVRFWHRQRSVAVRLYNVTFEYEHKKICARGLLDTGNSLREPTTGYPVGILECGLLGILPEHISQACMNRSEPGFFLVPYRCVGRENGILYALWIENVELSGADGGKPKYFKRMLMGLYLGLLSGGGEYQVILHPDFLTEGVGSK